MTSYYETIHAFSAAINAMDEHAWAECFAEDCELNDPVGSPTARGRQAARDFFCGFKPLLNAVHFRAGKIIVCGNSAAFTWAMEGTGKTGNFATADGIDVLEFDSAGKITKSYGYWDPAQFVAALTR